jgi:hypothetical protein
MTVSSTSLLAIGMQTPVASTETREAGLHGYGKCVFELQRQFRPFFPGIGQSYKSDNLESTTSHEV